MFLLFWLLIKTTMIYVFVCVLHFYVCVCVLHFLWNVWLLYYMYDSINTQIVCMVFYQECTCVLWACISYYLWYIYGRVLTTMHLFMWKQREMVIQLRDWWEADLLPIQTTHSRLTRICTTLSNLFPFLLWLSSSISSSFSYFFLFFFYVSALPSWPVFLLPLHYADNYALTSTLLYFPPYRVSLP